MGTWFAALLFALLSTLPASAITFEYRGTVTSGADGNGLFGLLILPSPIEGSPSIDLTGATFDEVVTLNPSVLTLTPNGGFRLSDCGWPDCLVTTTMTIDGVSLPIWGQGWDWGVDPFSTDLYIKNGAIVGFDNQLHVNTTGVDYNQEVSLSGTNGGWGLSESEGKFSATLLPGAYSPPETFVLYNGLDTLNVSYNYFSADLPLNEIVLAGTPEPATWAIVLAGFALVSLRVRHFDAAGARARSRAARRQIGPTMWNGYSQSRANCHRILSADRE